MMPRADVSNITKGCIGTYLAAAELVRQGFIVSALSQTAKGIDILAAEPTTLRPLAIQVKTSTKNRREWMLSASAELYKTPGLFYCLVRMLDGSAPEFFVVPAGNIARSVRLGHRRFLKRGGRDNPIRLFRDTRGTWLNRWDVLRSYCRS
jgi:hypothetical protein